MKPQLTHSPTPAPGRCPRSRVRGESRARSAFRVLPALALAALTAVLGGCGFVGFPGVYRIDVEQGNLVDQEMIEQLQLGMSRRQVRFIMGSPLVEDTFNPDRWDYPYVIRNGRDVIREAQVSILFDGDRLVEVRGDFLPEWARDAQPAAEPGVSAGESGDSATGDAPATES